MDRGVLPRVTQETSVRRTRVSYLLAGSALGLALTVSSYAVQAQTAEAPIPAVGELSPPTDADLQTTFGVPATAATKPAETVTKPVEAATPAAPADNKAVAEAPPQPDQQIASKLREQAGSKLDRILPRKNERSAVEAFYKDRNYAPLWLTDGALNARGKAAINYLAHVDRDGLDPADYAVPDFKSAADADAQADAELKLTAAVITYARHALYGRIAWSRVSADIFYDSQKPDTTAVLKQLGESNDMAATLDGFEPQYPAYQKLKKALAEARGGKVEEKKAEAKPAPRVHISEGKILRPGMRDERVVQLRKRLNIGGDSSLYDEDVQNAVKAFQTEADLNADGNLGPNTTRALNGERHAESAPKNNVVDTIIVNLDRWRWLPRELGNPYVVVNIPDYRLTLWKNEQVFWSTKIVVGKPALPTPLISAQMKYITVNPTWNVPPSIIEKEYLPALEQDPNALERIGLRIEQEPDGTVRVWQPPGAGNALGRIRFNFPNKFLVYQHDTPDKYLFAKEKRAYSHGCMRVENPLVYGEKLLSLVLPEEHYTQAKLEHMFGGSEININFPANKYIAVHLTYQTAFVDPDGKLQLREDVYGRDARMIAILKGEHKVADIPVERPPNQSSKPVRLSPGMYGGGGRDYGYSGGGGNFFDWMFGGGRRYYDGPRRRTDNGRVTFR